MIIMTIGQTYTLAGVSFQTPTKQLPGDAAVVQTVNVPKAETSVLTTRTDDNDGTLTLDDSDSILEDADRIDIYWTESGVNKAARGGTVGTISGALVPFTGFTGDVLPTTSTPVTVAKVVELDTTLLGTNILGFAFSCVAARSTFVVTGVDDLEDFAKVLGEGSAYVWYEGVGEDNPITGDSIAKTFVSHALTTTSAEIKVGYSYVND